MKCPGQDTQYWKPGAIFEVQCPKCNRRVEFFKDDTSRTCGNCGHRFVNPEMDFGCASYCQYAEQCLGTLPPELMAQKEDLLKDRVAIEMKRYFKTDFGRIGHASRVARYAERIGKYESGNLAVILTAAYLYDTGKGGAGDGEPDEPEGPVVARSILEKLGAGEKLIGEVCDIIAHRHRPTEGASINLKVVHDADRIASLEEEQKENPLSPETLGEKIETGFLTGSGREQAETVLLGN